MGSPVHMAREGAREADDERYSHGYCSTTTTTTTSPFLPHAVN